MDQVLMMVLDKFHGSCLSMSVLAVDIWSLGVVFHVFLCGSLPFNGPDLLTLFKKVLEVDY